MLVESLIKKAVELQIFRVVTVQKTGHGLEATLAPDGRFALRGGACRKLARYRDTSATLCFWHVPLWGIDVHLLYVPRCVSCKHYGGIHVETMPWASGKRVSPAP